MYAWLVADIYKKIPSRRAVLMQLAALLLVPAGPATDARATFYVVVILLVRGKLLLFHALTQFSVVLACHLQTSGRRIRL